MTVGGKPNQGTSKDKRLTGNKAGKPAGKPAAKGTPKGFKPFTKK